MNESPAPPPPGEPSRPWLWPALVLLGLALAAVTNHSFWIDECVTARAIEPANFFTAWRAVVALKFAEVQMPLFIAYMWAFERIFGNSELALRLAGLPFYLVGMTALAVAWARRWGRHWPVVVAVGLSPFVWYYLNEARLYTMQLGATALVVAALIRLGDAAPLPARSESRWFGAFLVGVILLSAISMLGEMWAGAALLAVFVGVPRNRWLAWWRMRRGALLATGAALLGCGFFYLWSLSVGARASLVGTTNWQTFLFIFYEQLGFTGLGPGRVELRESGARALAPFAPGLAAYALAVGAVLLAGLNELWRSGSRRQTGGLVACLAVPSGLILLAGVLTHFRVLGRHFAPLAVVLFLVLGVGLATWWRRGGWGKVVVAGFILATLASSLLIRFAPRHDKDDYRQAAAVANAALARGEVVWWNAADMAADYYRVPTTFTTTNAPAVRVLFGPVPGFAQSLPAPATVIASKPDVYDASGGLAAYLEENGYAQVGVLRAFTIWRKP